MWAKLANLRHFASQRMYRYHCTSLNDNLIRISIANCVGPQGTKSASAFENANSVTMSGGIINVIGGDSIVNNFNTYHLTSLENEISKIAPWLTSVNYGNVQMDRFSKRTPNTGKWIIDTPLFQKWISGDGVAFIWGIGIPGAGKTILSSIVVDYLQEISKGTDNICIAFAYCLYTDPVHGKDILAALLKQILQRYPAVFQLVKPLYDIHQCQGTAPSQLELTVVLEQIATSGIFTRSFYCLDGLDEAPIDVQIDVISILSSLSISLFITSRSMDSLKDLAPSARFFDVVARDSDIVLLVNEQVNRIPTLRRLLIDDWKEKVVAKILEKSCGMFLLASLQVDALRQCLSVKDLRDVLDGLPKGLDDMYSMTMHRIGAQPHAELARRVLLWLIYARRSLSMEELRYAVSVCEDTFKFDPERLVEPDALLSLCCGLIVFDQESQVVRLVHYTASDYLKPVLARWYQDPQSLIASICTACLFQNSFHNFLGSFKDVLCKLIEAPFLNYSYHNWDSHAREADALPQIVEDFVSGCQKYPFERRYRLLWDWLCTPIQLTVACGFLQRLSAFASDLQRQSKRGTTFDINTRTSCGATPLMLATELGSATISVLLQVPGIDVNAGDAQGRTALMGTEDIEVVQVLLSSAEGIDVNARDNNGRTALINAASEAPHEVVEVLIGVTGIDVNAADMNGKTALIEAASRGYLKIVEALLAVGGIDINMADVDGRTALMEALEPYYTTYADEILKALLATPGIDVNAKDSGGKTAFMQAVDRGQLRAVKALLQIPGVDPTAPR
ncbi:ankyrin [Coprinopsis marcescibilis]|uniref:Ankyrin n=1 Tax=Coprinopsis marcescibilis TaxID=230819 RepID=A0A5C3KWB8_COPMA|nr:ankyrin [Coprinopsis marcescibilis]